MSDMLARLMALVAMQSGGADLSDYYTKAETDRHISDEVARIVSDAPEDFDTLRELSDWISTHEESAAAMNSAIQANTAGVAALYAEVATKAPQSTTYTKTEVDTALTSMATNCLQCIETFGASGDFNAQTTIGIYRYNGGPLNHPTSDSTEYGLLMVLAYGSYVSQICHVFNPAVSGIYIRTLVIGSAWSAWNRLTGTAVT